MSDDEVEAGNVTKCQSPDVLRQSVYESRRKNQLCDDMVLEVRLQKNAWNASILGDKVNGYIQGCGLDPFYVVMYTEKQIQMYISAINAKECVTLHFDSTGYMS